MPGWAQTLTLSPDTTVLLGAALVEDQTVAADAGSGAVVPVPGASPPPSADVIAHETLASGEQLFALDTTSELAGGVVVAPGDVVRFDGAASALEFDASAEGIPAGVAVDAVTVDASGRLLLSFDSAVDLGGGVVASDEDLVDFDGASFDLVFDGSARGVADALDLDGASFRASDGLLLLSFDGSGSVGGQSFADEDVLAFEPVASTWSLFYDGSALHPSLVAADVVALPEPVGPFPLLVAGASLFLLRRRGRRL